MNKMSMPNYSGQKEFHDMERKRLASLYIYIYIKYINILVNFLSQFNMTVLMSV